MTDILLTGITGFIGTHLADRLINDGYNVFGIVKPSVSRDIKLVKKYVENAALLTADLSDFHSVRNTMRTINPDIVVHLAALSPVRESFERPFEYFQTNTIGTMNLVNSMIEQPDMKNKSFILASTAEVYGLQEKKPFTEELPLNPTSPYAVSKAAADMYLRMISGVYDLNGIVLRPTNSYGRKFDKSFFVEYLVTEMLNGNKIYIGAPDSVRDYMYVDDHVNAYFLVIKNAKMKNVFNVGTGIGMSNRELALKIAKLIGFDENKIVFGSYPPGYPFRPRISDQPYIVLNSEKIKKHLEWEPKVKFDEGIRKVIEYWKDKI